MIYKNIQHCVSYKCPFPPFTQEVGVRPGIGTQKANGQIQE